MDWKDVYLYKKVTFTANGYEWRIMSFMFNRVGKKRKKLIQVSSDLRVRTN